MGRLFEQIRQAVSEEHYLISWHADEQCEERGVAPWQLAAALGAGRLLRERPASKPHPSIVGEQELADGAHVQAVWSLMRPSGRAKLVTVYFR